jgi:integrase
VRSRLGRGRSSAQLSALADAIESYLADLALRVAPKTAKESRAALERIQRETGWSSLLDVDRDGVNRWRAARAAAGISHRTINRQVGELRAALNLAVEDGRIERNPLDGMRALDTRGKNRRRTSRSLPDSDADRLFAAAEQIDRESPLLFPRAPLLRTLWDTGARWHELVQVTWADLDEARSSLRFRAETTKTSEERKFPLKRTTLDRLVSLRAEHTRVTGRFPTASTRIFLAPKGGKWGQDTNRFHVFLREAMRRARIEHTDSDGRVFHIHALRPERRS